MKHWWTRNAQRIDALSQRERIFLFASVLVMLLAVVDTLWLSPAQDVQKQLSLRFNTQSAEAKRLRQDLQATGQPTDSGAIQRSERARVDARLAAVQQEIAALAPAAQDGPDLEQVLLQFLRRQEGLTLVSVGTLKAEAPVSAQATGVLRQGMELRVMGSYPALVRYVRTLESAMPALRWGPVGIRTLEQGAELSLQVYLVGVALP